MKYTVVWKPAADEALSEIWMGATDRNKVTRAAREIEKMLLSNPREVGESRDRDHRILFEQPLGVMYAVNSQDMLVKVLKVWHIGPRRR